MHLMQTDRPSDHHVQARGLLSGGTVSFYLSLPLCFMIDSSSMHVSRKLCLCLLLLYILQQINSSIHTYIQAYVSTRMCKCMCRSICNMSSYVMRHDIFDILLIFSSCLAAAHTKNHSFLLLQTTTSNHQQHNTPPPANIPIIFTLALLLPYSLEIYSCAMQGFTVCMWFKIMSVYVFVLA